MMAHDEPARCQQDASRATGRCQIEQNENRISAHTHGAHIPQYWRHFCSPGARKRDTVVTFATQGRRSTTLSSLLQPRGAEARFCRQFCSPWVWKHETVVIFAAQGRGSTMLSSHLQPRGAEAPYCYHFCSPEAQKHDAVVTFAAQGRGSTILSSLL